MSSAQPRPNLPDPSPLTPAAPGPEPRKPKQRGWIWLLLGAVAIVAVVVVGRQAPWRSGSTPAVTIRTATLRAAPLESTIRLTGMAVGEKSAVLIAPLLLGSRTDGNYTQTLQELVSNGAMVKKGEKVAEFDRQYMLLRLDDYDSVVVQHERYMEMLVARFDVVKMAHKRRIIQAKATWDKALLNLKTAPVRSEIQIEKFRIAAGEAKSRYNEYLVQAEYLDASEGFAIRRLELDLRECRIEAARARKNVEKMALRAPIDGLAVISTIYRGTENTMIRAGDRMYPGQILMQIVDTKSMVVEASVNQVDAEHLRIGAKARIQLESFPEVELPGHVVSIGVFAKIGTFRRSYLSAVPVRLKLDRLDPRIIPNLSATADVLIAARENATVIPRECLFDEPDGGKRIAFVRNGELWERREVEVGLQNHVAAEVVSGLRSGEEVAAERVPAEMLAVSPP